MACPAVFRSGIVSLPVVTPQWYIYPAVDLQRYESLTFILLCICVICPAHLAAVFKLVIAWNVISKVEVYSSCCSVQFEFCSPEVEPWQVGDKFFSQAINNRQAVPGGILSIEW